MTILSSSESKDILSHCAAKLAHPLQITDISPGKVVG